MAWKWLNPPPIPYRPEWIERKYRREDGITVTVCRPYTAEHAREFDVPAAKPSTYHGDRSAYRRNGRDCNSKGDYL